MGSSGLRNRTSFPWIALWTHPLWTLLPSWDLPLPHRGYPSLGHYPPAVITELEDVVGIRESLGAHDGLEERLCQLLPIHVESALEEPVSAVLAMGVTWRGEGRRRPEAMLLTSITGRVTALSDLDNIKIPSHNLQTLAPWTVQIQSEEKNQDLNVNYWADGEPRLQTLREAP